MDRIPSYALYGEPDALLLAAPDVLHCETITARASLHQWQIRVHRHQGLCQLFWVRSGRGTVRLEGEEHRFGAATALYIPSMTVHGFDFEPGTAGWVITLPTASIEEAVGADAPLLAALDGPCIAAAPDDPPEPLFRDVAAEHAASRPHRERALRALTGVLAVWFARVASRGRHDARDEGGPTLALVRRFLDRIESTYREHRRVAAHAAALGVSPAHLSRACRAVLGRPASKVVHDRLLLEARRNLVYTSMRIAEISDALGFTDPAYFSRFFATRAGLAPGRFRAAMHDEGIAAASRDDAGVRPGG